MKASIPPIVRAADLLLAEVERAITPMARRHKYSFGTRLSNAAVELAQIANRAWLNRSQRLESIKALVQGIDDFKTLTRLGHNLEAFRSKPQFQLICRLAYDLGNQAGGWLKSFEQHPKGQNAPPPSGGGQRAQILSSRAAQPSGAER